MKLLSTLPQRIPTFALPRASTSLAGACRSTMSAASPSTGGATRWATQRAERIHAELNAGVDVWTLFNPVVFPTAINLGQGFMNWQPPSYILDAITTEFANRVDLHHYSHPKGRPRLRQAISDFTRPSSTSPRELAKATAFGRADSVLPDRASSMSRPRCR